mgnify:FL=1
MKTAFRIALPESQQYYQLRQMQTPATADVGTVLMIGGDSGYSPGLQFEKRRASPQPIQMICPRLHQLPPLL